MIYHILRHIFVRLPQILMVKLAEPRMRISWELDEHVMANMKYLKFADIKYNTDTVIGRTLFRIDVSSISNEVTEIRFRKLLNEVGQEVYHSEGNICISPLTERKLRKTIKALYDNIEADELKLIKEVLK